MTLKGVESLKLNIDWSKCNGKKHCGVCTQIDKRMPSSVKVSGWVLSRGVKKLPELLTCCPYDAISL